MSEEVIGEINEDDTSRSVDHSEDFSKNIKITVEKRKKNKSNESNKENTNEQTKSKEKGTTNKNKQKEKANNKRKDREEEGKEDLEEELRDLERFEKELVSSKPKNPKKSRLSGKSKQVNQKMLNAKKNNQEYGNILSIEDLIHHALPDSAPMPLIDSEDSEEIVQDRDDDDEGRSEEIEDLEDLERAGSKKVFTYARITLTDDGVTLETNREAKKIAKEKARRLDDDGEVVNEPKNQLINNNSFRKKKNSNKRWSESENCVFYELLRKYGPDFSMISSLMEGRTRDHIKNKFKREEKSNPEKIEFCLKNKLPINLEEHNRKKKEIEKSKNTSTPKRTPTRVALEPLPSELEELDNLEDNDIVETGRNKENPLIAEKSEDESTGGVVTLSRVSLFGNDDNKSEEISREREEDTQEKDENTQEREEIFNRSKEDRNKGDESSEIVLGYIDETDEK